jgi:hypothetical protein
MGAYDAEAKQYLLDVSAYVRYIKTSDRRVFKRLDPWDARFDQRRDEHLPFRNPPTRFVYTQGHEPTYWELCCQWWRAP